MWDFWRLQRAGYDVYRQNIHVNHEIFDWQGFDANVHQTSADAAYIPVRAVRSMDNAQAGTPQLTDQFTPNLKFASHPHLGAHHAQARTA